MKKCIKSELVEVYYGFEIRRETDKHYDPETGELYGHAQVFYAVCDEDCMIGSFKTFKEARKFIEKIL